MPQLNRDLLREVFYEIIKPDKFGRSIFNENIAKFMMAGKEPFQLVLDHCKKANHVVISEYKIIAKLPNVKYIKPDAEFVNRGWKDSITGTEIFSNDKLDRQMCSSFLFYKPISIALVSTLTSLDLRSFSPALIPILKAIDQEMTDVNIRYVGKQVKNVLAACVNIPNVQNGVKLQLTYNEEIVDVMKFLAIKCHKLTINNAYFNALCPCENFSNSHLQNIRDLTIEGEFLKSGTLSEQLKEFGTFLSSNFLKLKTLNIIFEYRDRYSVGWNWNNPKIANCFKTLPSGIKGCICFKIISNWIGYLDRTKYPDVQRDGNEYFKIFPITETLCFKMAWVADPTAFLPFL